MPLASHFTRALVGVAWLAARQVTNLVYDVAPWTKRDVACATVVTSV